MNPDGNHMIIAAILGFYMVFYVIIMAVIIFPFWFVLRKAGFSPWLSLVNIFPLGTMVLLYVLAFADWKVVPAPQVAWQSPYTPQPPSPPQV